MSTIGEADERIGSGNMGCSSAESESTFIGRRTDLAGEIARMFCLRFFFFFFFFFFVFVFVFVFFFFLTRGPAGDVALAPDGQETQHTHTHTQKSSARRETDQRMANAS